MKHASLFSGIGGFDLAAELMGWTNVFCCEKEEFCQQILKYHFPESKIYDDVKTFNATEYNGRIDVLTGGFPCQPFSHAGKRMGSEDDRHLWPEMLRIISECKPQWVVGENVRGIISWSDGMVLEEVCVDLESVGYAIESFVIPAAGTNAPHRRDRLFVVAHSDSVRLEYTEESRSMGASKGEMGEFTSNTAEANGSDGFATNPDSERPQRPEVVKAMGEVQQGSGRGGAEDSAIHAVASERMRSFTDSYSNGLQGSVSSDEHRQERSKEAYAEERLHLYRRRIQFEDFPTFPPVCGRNDGIPRNLDSITFSKWRRESIKGYGNAICVPVVLNIFKAIQNYENLSKLQPRKN